MVKEMVRPLEKALKPLNNFLRNEYVTAVVALFVVLYASNVAPKVPQVISDLFSNPIFRVFVLFLVAYISNKNPSVALLVSIAFVVTLNVINRQEAEEGFLDVIDTFNTGVERFQDNSPECPASIGGDERWQTKCRQMLDDPKADQSKLNSCCNCAASKGYGGTVDECVRNTQSVGACTMFAQKCKVQESGEENDLDYKEEDGEESENKKQKYTFVN